MDCAETEEKTKIEKIENNKIEENGTPTTNPNMIQFWSNIQGHIQDLVKSAIVNAKEEENHTVDNKEGKHSDEDYSKETQSPSWTLITLSYLHACQQCVS